MPNARVPITGLSPNTALNPVTLIRKTFNVSVPPHSEHPKYDLLEKCGAGGMGVVYRAKDRQLNRIVALKFLAPGLTGSADDVARFRREAEAIAALNHPNVATLFEAGEWDGQPFLALEYLPGGMLKDRIPPQGLDLLEVLQYARQLGAGLAGAHRQNILHRDIKPSNGMFSAQGVLKLVDFGLAKSNDSSALDISHAGVVVGTVNYMAPEVLSDGTATPRSDQYSFAALIYEMAAGRPVFSAHSTVSLIKRVLTDDPQPLASLRTDIPVALSDAVNRALSRNPADRFDSVQEFLDKLEWSSRHGPSPDTLPTKALTQSCALLPAPRHIPRFARWALWPVLALLIAAAFGISRMFLPVRQHQEIVAVLPFENLGGDAANQPLCDGLQETVTSILSRPQASSRGVQLIPSSEIRRSQIHTIADARKQFNATLVLTGTVQKSSSGLQLTLNLDDAATNRQKDSRILTLPAATTGDLPDQLAGELQSLLGLSSLAPAISGQTTKNAKAYELYLEGDGALETRKLDRAAAALEAVVKMDPQFDLARAKLAETYVRLSLSTKDPKWLALADTEIERASRNGVTPESLLVQAMIRQSTGKHAQAIALLRQLLKIAPNNDDAYRLLATSLDASGQPQEAEKTYQEAVRLRPLYWPGYNFLGHFYATHHRYAEAEKAYLTGIGIAPDVASLYMNLGALYFNANRQDEAVKAYQNSNRITPNGFAYANLCTIHFFQGRYQEAEQDAERAVQLQPANALNWGNLGDAAWQIPAHRRRALEAFSKAASLANTQLALNPTNVQLRKSLALYLAKLGRSKEAIREIRTSLAQAPSDMYVQLYAARVYSTCGDAKSAKAALKTARSLGINPMEIDKDPDLQSVK